MSVDPRIEAAARALNIGGWTCQEGSDEPGNYDNCADCKRYCDEQATAALAAADKASIVTTMEELDALAVESVVRDAYGIVFENDLLDQTKARKWATLIDNELVASARVSLPARVLYLGGS